MASESITPIFPVSSVTGQNLSVLTSFLNLLPPVSDLRNNSDLPTEFLISEKFTVEGKPILAGTVIKGNINKGQILQLGPDSKGNFRPAEVVDVRCVRVRVDYARCGQTCTLQVNPLSYCKEWLEKEPNAIRRGMVLVESKTNPRAAYEFQADLELYPGACEVVISRRYEPVVNTLTTRQSCIIVVLAKGEDAEDLEDFPELAVKKEKSKSICGRSRTRKLADSASNPKGPGGFKLEPKRSHDFSAEKEHKDKEVEKPKRKPLQKIREEGVPHRKKKEEVVIRPDRVQSLRLRFKYYPEYIKVGQKLLVNDGLLKAVGRITDIYY